MVYPRPPLASEVPASEVYAHVERLYLEGLPALAGCLPPEGRAPGEVPFGRVWGLLLRRGWAPAAVLRDATRAWRKRYPLSVPDRTWVWSASRLLAAPAPSVDGFEVVEAGEVADEARRLWTGAQAALRGVSGEAETRRAVAVALDGFEDLRRRAPAYAHARAEALRGAALRGAWVWPSPWTGGEG